MKMKMKKIALSLSLLIWGAPAYSLVINDEITGADMAGIEVTAYFSGGDSETVIWATTSTDASVPFDEGFAGGVTGNGWSLSQQGGTLGNIALSGQLLGLWTLSSSSNTSLIALEIDALVADIVFDIVFDTEETPGSGIGRAFLSDQTLGIGTNAVYSDLVNSPDLYGSLRLDWGPNGFTGDLQFMADTDRITVPEPMSALLLATGLLGMAAGAGVRSRKQQYAMKNEA